ncbi:MAG TPA: Mov34/MPN/PAD-1 family protein [Candidatus Angelobacter sp.]|nr:Mov34/MPN/PAD-1 family protein [Candidatus Angelobacter sp.]
MTSQHIKVKVKSQPVVVMEAEVARKIRQHARTSMKAEVCGVLIGTMDNDRTVIEACIAGVNAAQGGAHVTFTQDTWEHIYKIKDQQYPDDKIVGWYHSHPGFGVFLSEHDLFIHENFFSSPQQIAWVYDPHTDEEGCFGWVGGKTEKLSGIRTGYSQSVEMTASHGSENESDYDEDGVDSFDSQVKVGGDKISGEPLWVMWTTRVLGYLAVLLLGFAGGYQYLAWRLAPDLRAIEQMAQKLHDYEVVLQEPAVRACVERFLNQFGGGPSGQDTPGTGSQRPPQSQPPQSQPQPKGPAESGKGTNGKH